MWYPNMITSLFLRKTNENYNGSTSNPIYVACNSSLPYFWCYSSFWSAYMDGAAQTWAHMMVDYTTLTWSNLWLWLVKAIELKLLKCLNGEAGVDRTQTRYDGGVISFPHEVFWLVRIIEPEGLFLEATIPCAALKAAFKQHSLHSFWSIQVKLIVVQIFRFAIYT